MKNLFNNKPVRKDVGRYGTHGLSGEYQVFWVVVILIVLKINKKVVLTCNIGSKLNVAT